MPYYCNFNGTGGFSSPTLGNLLSGSPKLKIVVKKFNLAGTSTTLSGVFWAGGISVSNREFVLRRNNGNLELFVGGTVNTLCTVAAAAAAYGTASMTCDEWAVELDGTTARMYKDGAVVITNASITRGTSRLDLARFRIGCQPADDAAGNLGSTTFAPSGTQFGDMQFLINDVVVRNYTIPSTGTSIPDSVGGNDFVQSGTWPTGDGEWVFYSSGGTYTLSADGATFSYSGAAASTLFNRQLPSDGATYSYSGGAASTLYNRRLSADGTVYSYSGGAAAALYNRKLSADGGTYSYSGAAATLTYTATGVVYTLNADGAVFGYTGAAASLLANRALTADGGSFTYSGGSAEFDFNGYPQADANAFVVSYRIAGDTVLTASISESTRFSAIISQSTNIKYMVN